MNPSTQKQNSLPLVTGASTGSKARRSDFRTKCFESSLYRYMKKNYQEHFRKVVSWRKAARWAVMVYPIFTAVFLAVPFVLLSAIFRHLYKVQPEWFSSILAADSSSFVLQLCSTLAGVALLGGLLLGAVFGVARSRALYFEAERIEMNVRQSFYLAKLARRRRKTKLS